MQERQRAGILPHCLIVFRAAPLGIHGHLCAVDAAMERRSNEARRAVDRAFGCASEKIDKSLLIDVFDREDGYRRDYAPLLGRLVHETPRFNVSRNCYLDEAANPWPSAHDVPSLHDILAKFGRLYSVCCAV